MWKSILAAVGLLTPALAVTRYDQYKLVNIVDPSPEVYQTLVDVADIWGEGVGNVEALLSPRLHEQLSQELGSSMVTIVDDIQKYLDMESAHNFKKLSNEPERFDFNYPSKWFENYHTYDEIKQFYKDLSVEFSDMVTFYPSIGRTHENRDIFAVKLSKGNETGTEKPQIFYQGLHHAREWIGGAVVQYLTVDLLTNNTALLNDYEYIIVPVVNPDGYSYTWTNDRLWRKNRRNNGGSYGVDLNRNWDDHWGQGGSSSLPTSDTYKGPSPASEPEVQAVSSFYLQQRDIVVAIDWHCYSQLILRPYGWKKGNAIHEKELFQVGEGMRNIIRSVHGKSYDNIHSEELYITTGSAGDWYYGDIAYSKFGKRPYAFTFELRPNTAYPGFVLDAKEIIPSGEEIVPAMVYLAQFARENPLN